MKKTLGIVFLLLVAGVLNLAAQTEPSAPSADVQNVVFSCPMHPEVRHDKPGECPICKMELEQVAESQAVQKD